MTGRLWRGGMVFGGLMLLWGLASRSGIPHFLLPSPLAVAEALWVNRAYLGWHTLITLSEILSGLALGQTVLSKACIAAGMPFDGAQAHSALYDTEQTAQLFCEIVNRWKRLGGWPLPVATPE